jgi:hypothetical protein
MRRLRRLFNQIIRRALRHRPGRPQDIPKKLNPDALSSALAEARFLQAREVAVKDLEREEIPGLPRAADPD